MNIHQLSSIKIIDMARNCYFIIIQYWQTYKAPLIGMNFREALCMHRCVYIHSIWICIVAEISIMY